MTLTLEPILLNGKLISRNVPSSLDQYEYPCLLLYVDDEIRYSALGYTHLYGEPIEEIFRNRLRNRFLILHNQELLDENDYGKTLHVTYYKTENEPYHFMI